MEKWEYTAPVEDVCRSYVTDALHPDDMSRRQRAFERMIREIEDAAYEQGQADALAFGRDGH